MQGWLSDLVARGSGGGAHAERAELSRRQAAALRGLPDRAKSRFAGTASDPNDNRGSDHYQDLQDRRQPRQGRQHRIGKAGVTLMNNQVGVVVAKVMDR